MIDLNPNLGVSPRFKESGGKLDVHHSIGNTRSCCQSKLVSLEGRKNTYVGQ